MKRLTRRTSTRALTVVAAIAVVTLSACAGSGSSNSSSSSGSSVLTIQGDAGNPTLVENFNPYSSTELGGTRLIYEPMEIASTIDGSFTPFLATGHKVMSPTSVVFSLRNGVKWSDGKPFSAADVVFSFNLLKKFAALDTTGVWAQLKSVSAKGNQVTFTLKAPDVPFVTTLAQVPIVPQHLWSKVKDPTKYANTKPVGTGPFMLTNFAPTEYTLKKNPSYWNAANIAPTAVKYPAQSSNQSTNQLDVASGKFDWSYNYLPDVQQTYVSKDPSTRSYWFPPGGVIGLFLNQTKAPFNDVNFRQGISHLLNRNLIAKKAVNGYMSAASMTGLILPNLQKWLDPSIPNGGMITPDKAVAMKYFAKAGYKLTGGKLEKNGQQASMSIVLPNNYSDWVAAAKEVSSELSAAGMKISLDEPTSTQYGSQIAAGNFQAAFGGFGGTGVPYTDFNNALNSSFATPIGTATYNNFERFKSPTVDAALANLARATTMSAQKQATYKLEQVMYKQAPIVLMYYGGSWGLFQTTNFTGWPSAHDPYTLPTPYNNMVLVVVSHLKRS